MRTFRTRSSVGRVSVSEAEGRWFDPSRVRHIRGRLKIPRRVFSDGFFRVLRRGGICACLLTEFALSYALFTFLNTLRSKPILKSSGCRRLIRSRTPNRRSENRHYRCAAKPGFIIGLQAE